MMNFTGKIRLTLWCSWCTKTLVAEANNIADPQHATARYLKLVDRLSTRALTKGWVHGVFADDEISPCWGCDKCGPENNLRPTEPAVTR